MKSLNSKVTIGEIVSELDLKLIRGIFTREYGGHRDLKGVSVLKIETIYRQFLFLSCVFPNRKIVLPKPVDWFWHCHILDTEKYQKDCNLIFGEFFHHHPYFGVCGKEDEAEYIECLAATANIFVENFGENPHELFSSAAVCGGRGISSELKYRFPTVAMPSIQ